MPVGRRCLCEEVVMVETRVTKHSVATERAAAEEEATKGPAACVAPRSPGCGKAG